MGGSTGSSGAIGYPTYITWFHYQLMSGGVQKPDFTASASGGGNNTVYQSHLDAIESTNPYTGVAAYNPATNLTNFQTEVTRLRTLLSEMSSETDWDTFVTNIISNADEALYLTDATKEEAVRNFRVKEQQTLARSYNRMSGAMNDINAVAGTAFLGGIAIIESEFDNNVASFRSQLDMEMGKARLSGTVQLLGLRIEGLLKNALAQGDYARISTVALSEQIKEDVLLDKDEIFWEHEIHLRTTAIMSAMSSGAAQAGRGSSSGSNKVGAALSGGLSGAVAGATVTGGNPIGAGIGAVIGITAGALQS